MLGVKNEKKLKVIPMLIFTILILACPNVESKDVLTLNTPVTTIVDNKLNVEFSWGNISDAKNYFLEVIRPDTGQQIIAKTDLTENKYVSSLYLYSQTEYILKVTAFSPTNTKIEASELTFTTGSFNPDLTNLSQDSRIAGLWIENWCWSRYNNQRIPSSYAYIGDTQFETFCYFNGDGTGIYFERLIKIDGLIHTNESSNLDEIIQNNDPVPYTVITTIDGKEVETNALNRVCRIFWGVNESGKLVIYKEDSIDGMYKTETEFSITDKADDFTFITVDKLSQEKDLITDTFGEFGKIPDNEKQIILNKYF